MKLTARINRKGFTLIELLVVIGILAILLAITLIAINPAKQFASANDTKRSSDVNEILNAIGQYMADTHGDLSGITGLTAATSLTPIGNGTGQVDLCVLVPKYIAALPSDPTRSVPVASSIPCGTGQPTYNTGYTVKDISGRITIEATPETTGAPQIDVTR